MPNQSGYFSWVCFIDVQRGAWFGPITQGEIESYENGFALDDNIKSYTEFMYYEEKPTTPLSCNFFSKRITLRNPVSPKTVTFSDCASLDSDHKSNIADKPPKSTHEKRPPRLLLYNKTDVELFATLSQHEGRKKIPGRPDWAEWRFINDYDRFLLKVFEGNSRVYALDLYPVGRDIHITFYENVQGYYHVFEEPW